MHPKYYFWIGLGNSPGNWNDCLKHNRKYSRQVKANNDVRYIDQCRHSVSLLIIPSMILKAGALLNFVVVTYHCTFRSLSYFVLFKRCHWFFKFQDVKKKTFLAYRIRKSEVFACDRNSYLTHVISPQKETFHVNLVCIGCIGCHATLPLGWRRCDVTMTSHLKIPYVNVIVCGDVCYFWNKIFEIERYARKRIKHERSVRIEKKFRDAKQWPSGRNFFYPPLTPMQDSYILAYRFPWTRTGLGNVVLHEGCSTTPVHDISMTILMSFWSLDVLFDVLTSFSRQLRQTFRRQRIREEPYRTFLIEKVSYFSVKLIKHYIFKSKCNCRRNSTQEKKNP